VDGDDELALRRRASTPRRLHAAAAALALAPVGAGLAALAGGSALGLLRLGRPLGRLLAAAATAGSAPTPALGLLFRRFRLFLLFLLLFARLHGRVVNYACGGGPRRRLNRRLPAPPLDATE